MLFSDKNAHRRYEENRRADLSGETGADGALNGQGRGALGELRFGRASVAHSGCEAIAVYNALRHLGLSRTLPEVIRDMELRGYLRLWGYMGATPWFTPLLRHYGVRSRVVLPAHLRRDQELGLLRGGETYLFSIWNDRLRPYQGLHTFAGTYLGEDAGGWLIWNRFNSDAVPRRYKTLRGILQNGKHTGAFLVIYQVEKR